MKNKPFEENPDATYLKKRFWGRLNKRCGICNNLIPLNGPLAKQGKYCGRKSCQAEVRKRYNKRRNAKMKDAPRS